MNPDDLVLFRNVGLTDADTGGQTSTVGEPSISNNGSQMFLTGNWYATRSLDHGQTWSHISPFNHFPSVDGGFCCDQSVVYDPSRDITIWLLQYVTSGNSNTLRLAVKRGPHLGNDIWHWWDFRPTTVDVTWENEWFDYNHAALSNNYLYVGSNLFTTDSNRWTRSMILRIPLDELHSGANLNFDSFQSTENFSLRCAQGARDVMHFVSHNTTQQLRLFSWPESSASVSSTDIDVNAWNAGQYSAVGPDGNDWLTRADPRITGVWVANNTVGAMWSANAVGQTRPFPFIRTVIIDLGSLSVTDQPDLWNPNFAFAYPAACPNDRGHVGVSMFVGGGTRNPGHVVGVRDDYSNGWSLRVSHNGTHGPVDGKWGDYLACQRHSPDGLTWVAAGFTLQGGSSRGSIVPRVVHFGRGRDLPAVQRWQ